MNAPKMKTVEITLPSAFWEQVRQKGTLVGVDFAEEKDLPKIVIKALEKCLGVYQEPIRQAIPFKL